MANIITVCRILLSMGLLTVPAFTPGFMVLYILAGISDVLDGLVARATDSVTSFGARLDTVADICFAGAAAAKILPEIDIPRQFLYWIVVIALIKTICIIRSLITARTFPAVHSTLNRITGLLLFLFPMTLQFIDVKIGSAVLCVIATAAALDEFRTAGKMIGDKCEYGK